MKVDIFKKRYKNLTILKYFNNTLYFSFKINFGFAELIRINKGYINNLNNINNFNNIMLNFSEYKNSEFSKDKNFKREDLLKPFNVICAIKILNSFLDKKDNVIKTSLIDVDFLVNEKYKKYFKEYFDNSFFISDNSRVFFNGITEYLKKQGFNTPEMVCGHILNYFNNFVIMFKKLDYKL